MTARGNPFASHHLEDLPFIGAPPGKLLEKLDELGSRAYIVGDHGHGKSRAVSSLLAHCRQIGLAIGHLELWDTKRRPSAREVTSLKSPELILIDGFEQLSILGRFRLLRALPARAAVIATVHRRPLWPHWQTLARLETSPTLLGLLLDELGVELDQAQIERRWSAAGGDLREVFWRLYDDWSQGISSPLRRATSMNCGVNQPASISRSAARSRRER